MRPSSMHQHVDDEDDEVVEAVEKAFEQEHFSAYEYVVSEPIYVGPLKLRIDLPIEEFIKT